MTADAESPFLFPPDAEQHVDAFLESAWPSLAGAAWRYYMRHGRGAVVVPWQHVEAIAGGAASGFNPLFITGHAESGVQKAMDADDPKTEVVLVFMGPRDFAAMETLVDGEGFRAFGAGYFRVLRMEPPPLDAHATHGN